MHGRLKVRTTAEQQEAKRKEREKKLKIYKGATAKAFHKKSAGEYDDEALGITGELLSGNPDFSTFWNFRREIYEHYIKEKEKEDLKKLFIDELTFLENCLRVNPKSYGTWHHREWVMDHMPEPDWKRELMLCNKFLEIDERNFHCWDYRRIVVRKSEVPIKDEFDYSTSKINANFSNFSSWHYRSKLLPILHSDPSQCLGVKEDVLNEEYELVQNAFFTDPNDQSSWFYHRWLLGRGEKQLEIDCIVISKEDKRVVVRFTKPVDISRIDLNVEVNQQTFPLEWVPSAGKFSSVWFATLKEIPATGKDSGTFEITMSKTKKYSVALLPEDSLQVWQPNEEYMSKFRNAMSAATTKILTQEFESIQQLHELEPDNKWVLLTLVSLARALDPKQYRAECKEALDKLRVVDPYRKNYYNDLESRFTIEDAIEDTNDKKLNLRDKNLTTLYHSDLMTSMTEIDLSHNSLTSVTNGGYLQCCKELSLDNNQLESVKDLKNLSSLRKLSVRNNLIVGVEDLRALSFCQNIEALDVSGNPVCNAPDIEAKIKEIIPTVQHINL